VFANNVLTSEAHDQIKQVAQNVIGEKNSEIEQMQKWEKEWQKSR
jgi:uncharacterized protein (DUF305 family)